MKWRLYSRMAKHRHAFFKHVFFGLYLALVTSCASASIDSTPTTDAPKQASQPEKSSRFFLEAPRDAVPQGGVFFVSVSSVDKLQKVEGQFHGKVIDFYPDPLPNSNRRRFTALVGAEYGIHSGGNPMSLRLKFGEETLETKTSIEIKEAEFPSERLRVPPRTVTPSKKDRAKIARDRALLARTYSKPTKVKYWETPLTMPIDSRVTSAYGSSRVYNGKKHNIHLGLDLKAPTGAPIVAPLTGKVVVARSLFFTGYTVILDHGFGFFTIYAHLSKLKVREGSVAKKGKLLGLAGATGRASGPHLHWGVNLHGARIDPLLLMKTLSQATVDKVP
ncbi:MAG: M23 family metallopeptidase [Bdellovibrionota bacterium]